MTRIRKILGRVVTENVSHSVAKLENDYYAVGQLTVGQMVEADAQFETLDAAFDHWLATLPTFSVHVKPARQERTSLPVRQTATKNFAAPYAIIR